MDIKGLVESVEFPETNDYFEKTCTDGYAFLGMAKHMLGLSVSDCVGYLVDHAHGMNSPRKINGITAPRDAVYTYCLCIDYEFFEMLGAKTICQGIIDQLMRIGCYPSGMMRYCNYEVHYQVPNVTALAALAYAKAGYLWMAWNLLNALKQVQGNLENNWCYYDTRIGEPVREEDSHHVAIITWALSELEAFSCVDSASLLLARICPACREGRAQGICLLDSLNQPAIVTSKHCSPGWNPAWVLAAATGQDEELLERALPIVEKTINHKNFRVRAASAWALARYGRHYGVC